MKKRSYVVGALAIAGVLFSVGTSLSGVVGSKHDFSTNGGGMWGATNEDEVCVFCHTPHAASTIAPLWNREIRNAVYQVYSSDSLDILPGQPQAETLACLSCHDGVTAMNSLRNPSPDMPTMDPMGDQIGDIFYPGSPFGEAANISGNYSGNPNANDLTDDHPVSFTFDGAIVAADGSLRLPPPGDAVRLYGSAGNQMECSTCHNPHDPAIPPFLRKSNAGSGLCMTCHVK